MAGKKRETHILTVVSDRRLGSGPWYVRGVSLLDVEGHFIAKLRLIEWSHLAKGRAPGPVSPPEVQAGLIITGGGLPGLVTPSSLNLLTLQGRRLTFSYTGTLPQDGTTLHQHGVEEIESLFGSEFNATLQREYAPPPA